MHLLKKIYYRSFQKVLYVGSFFLPWREPALIKGEGSLAQLPGKIKKQGIDKVLVVTDQGLMKMGLLAPFLKGLEAEGITYVLYDEVVPNPTIENVENCVKLYNQNRLEGIVAVGGGS